MQMMLRTRAATPTNTTPPTRPEGEDVSRILGGYLCWCATMDGLDVVFWAGWIDWITDYWSLRRGTRKCLSLSLKHTNSSNISSVFSTPMSTENAKSCMHWRKSRELVAGIRILFARRPMLISTSGLVNSTRTSLNGLWRSSKTLHNSRSRHGSWTGRRTLLMGRTRKYFPTASTRSCAKIWSDWRRFVRTVACATSGVCGCEDNTRRRRVAAERLLGYRKSVASIHCL